MTLEELISALEADLEWRQSELASLKSALAMAGKDTVKQKALLRASWALLYAHYEGFCKFAWDQYLDYLERKKIRRNDFIECILVFSLEKAFAGLKGDLSSESLWDFMNMGIFDHLDDDISFDKKLETDSNLWPNVLTDNCKKIGINIGTVDSYRSKLKALVSRRNEIAHGKKMLVKDITEYSDYENAAVTVMHDLALTIIDSAEKGSYLSKPQSSE